MGGEVAQLLLQRLLLRFQRLFGGLVGFLGAVFGALVGLPGGIRRAITGDSFVLAGNNVGMFFSYRPRESRSPQVLDDLLVVFGCHWALRKIWLSVL